MLTRSSIESLFGRKETRSGLFGGSKVTLGAFNIDFPGSLVGTAGKFPGLENSISSLKNQKEIKEFVFIITYSLLFSSASS